MSWFESKKNKAEQQSDDSVEALQDELTARAEALINQSQLDTNEIASVKAFLDAYRSDKMKSETFDKKLKVYEEFNVSASIEKNPTAPSEATEDTGTEAEKKPLSLTEADLIDTEAAKKLAAAASTSRSKKLEVDDDVIVTKRTDKSQAHQEAVRSMKGFEALAVVKKELQATRVDESGGIRQEKNVSETKRAAAQDRPEEAVPAQKAAEQPAESSLVTLVELYKLGDPELLRDGLKNKTPSTLVKEAREVLQQLGVSPESLKVFNKAIDAQFEELKNSPNELKKEAHKNFEQNFLTIVGNVIREFESQAKVTPAMPPKEADTKTSSEKAVTSKSVADESTKTTVAVETNVDASSVDAVVHQFLTNFESNDPQVKHAIRDQYRALFGYGTQNPTEANRQALNQLNYAYLLTGKYSKVTAELANNPNNLDLQAEQVHLRQQIEDSFKIVLQLAAEKGDQNDTKSAVPADNSKADALKADEFEANKLTEADYAADEMDAYEAGMVPETFTYKVKNGKDKGEERTGTRWRKFDAEKDGLNKTDETVPDTSEPLVLTEDKRVDTADEAGTESTLPPEPSLSNNLELEPDSESRLSNELLANREKFRKAFSDWRAAKQEYLEWEERALEFKRDRMIQGEYMDTREKYIAASKVYYQALSQSVDPENSEESSEQSSTAHESLRAMAGNHMIVRTAEQRLAIEEGKLDEKQIQILEKVKGVLYNNRSQETQSLIKKWGARTGAIVVVGGVGFATGGIGAALMGAGVAGGTMAGRSYVAQAFEKIGIPIGAKALQLASFTAAGAGAGYLGGKWLSSSRLKSNRSKYETSVSEVGRTFSADTMESLTEQVSRYGRATLKWNRNKKKWEIGGAVVGGAAGFVAGSLIGSDEESLPAPAVMGEAPEAPELADGVLSGEDTAYDEVTPPIEKDVPASESTVRPEITEVAVGPTVLSEAPIISEQPNTNTEAEPAVAIPQSERYVETAPAPEQPETTASAGTVPEETEMKTPDAWPPLEYHVEQGDRGVSYKLVETYPDLFKDMNRSEWEAFITDINNNSALLQAAGLDSDNINLIRPGETIRLDVLAEYKATGTFSNAADTISESATPPKPPAVAESNIGTAERFTTSPAQEEPIIAHEAETAAPPVSEALAEQPNVSAQNEASPTIPATEVPVQTTAAVAQPEAAVQSDVLPTATNLDVQTVAEATVRNEVPPAVAATIPTAPEVQLPNEMTPNVPAEETPVAAADGATQSAALEGQSPNIAPNVPSEAPQSPPSPIIEVAAAAGLFEVSSTVEQEFQNRMSEDMSIAEQAELLQAIAARVSLVDAVDTQLATESTDGLTEIGKLLTDRFIDAIDNNNLEQMLANYNVENPKYTEIISEMKQVGIIKPGMTLNESLEAALSNGRIGIDNSLSNPTLTIIRPGVFTTDYVLPLATNR